jgi:ABC-type transport system involved in cytochrome bd biosynthesis fused ATPase/permease subunit
VRTIPRLLALAAPLRTWLALAALTGFAALAANIALMTVAPYLISRSALVTAFADIAVAVTAVRGFAIARAALRYAERYTTHLAALRILVRLRVRVYRALEPLAPAGLAERRGGDVLARTVADVEALDGFYVRGLLPPLTAALAGGAACLVVGWLAPPLGLALLASLALAGVALPLAARRLSREPATQLAWARGELHAALAELLEGLADLLACGREDAVGASAAHWTAEMRAQQRRLAAMRGDSAAAGALLAGLAALALLVLAIPLVRSGTLPGVLLAAVPLVGLAAFEGVQSLGDAFRHVELGRAAATRTFELLDAPAPVPDPALLAPPTLAGPLDIELRGVRFRYRPAGPGRPCWTASTCACPPAAGSAWPGRAAPARRPW